MEDIRFEHLCLYDNTTGYAYQVIKQSDELIIRIHPKALLDLFNHLSHTSAASPAAFAYTDFLKQRFASVAVIMRPSATGLFEEATGKLGKRFTFCALLVGGSAPNPPVMQSKLCGCDECLRHSSAGLVPKNEKTPYAYRAS